MHAAGTLPVGLASSTPLSECKHIWSARLILAKQIEEGLAAQVHVWQSPKLLVREQPSMAPSSKPHFDSFGDHTACKGSIIITGEYPVTACRLPGLWSRHPAKCCADASLQSCRLMTYMSAWPFCSGGGLCLPLRLPCQDYNLMKDL